MSTIISNVQTKIQEEKDYKVLEITQGSDALAYILLLIGGVLWGIKGVTGINPVSVVPFINLVYIVVGIAALYIFRKKFFNQPYKSQMWMPGSALKDTQGFPDGYNFNHKDVNLKPGMKVIYWAALPSGITHKSMRDAFGDYSNMGISTVGQDGKTKISLRNGKPGKYIKRNKYFIKTTLPSMVYFRYQNPTGYMSEVLSIDIKD